MQSYQQQLIQAALEQNALQFGQFTLKSGRISPYFFNSGVFNTGSALQQVGSAYASLICTNNLTFDVLFGPAYKGIPFVVATAMMMSAQLERSVPYSFNRKTAKTHGDGGTIVGHSLQGQKVLIVDDVITAGTAVGHAAQLIEEQGGELTGIVTLLDRQERGQTSNKSAIAEVSDKLQVNVHSVLNLELLIDYIKDTLGDSQIYNDIVAYRKEYGATYIK